ncbi:Ribosome-binding protein 1 [Babesia bigemina]|uniref:Ribosome-binding protein 1 n=1 Tax=Babesia bigemina TaxID=5866 RepID=A0A061DEF9_BABBI|nr:Ribosome-binding protein 1 [Babesia bigemina]CDR97210.1 Ribosome-binding protein 1 [Babesia bigemina]|eukprot:XP_012769396.1 Ribosome-binding protein 1 [Babesia bigemina]
MADHGVPLKSLKDCMQFLQWLHDRKDVQDLVAHRLDKFLKDRYKSVSPVAIATDLSQFLNQVSRFHEKLCNKAEVSKQRPKTTKSALNALLECIPKVLSACYSLRYRVDAKFDQIGGGGWADKQVGQVTLFAKRRMPFKSRATEIEKYLIADDESQYGVIPGGFDAIELKESHQGGYAEGFLMVGDLHNICEKHAGRGLQNYFLDVYSTSVIPKTTGTQISNVANALRLVQDFCRIFEKVKHQDDFEKYLYLKDRCINMEDLTKHCAKLKKPIGDIFKKERFSFTGYAREDKHLYDEKFAKKMASWFRTHLNAVKEKFEKIKAFKAIIQSNERSFKRSTLDAQAKAKLADYFTHHFFPYGFTFHGHDFNTWGNTYDVLTKDWDGVIEKLNKTDEGLTKLVDILNGKGCKLQEVDKEHTVKDEEAEEEQDIPDVALQDEESEATKTEAAKPQIVQSDGAQNQGKKVEGAQNQNKKSEGAQNQGKKAEGNQHPQGDNSETNSPGSSVAKTVQTQTSSISSADSPSSGAPDTSSGLGKSGQGSASVPGRGSNQDGLAGAGDTNVASGDGLGVGGAEAVGLGSGVKRDSPNTNTKCSRVAGYREIDL